MMMQAHSQPMLRASNGMVAGAARHLTDAPLLKMAVDKHGLSLGNTKRVPTPLMAAGKLPSLTHSKNQAAREEQPYTDSSDSYSSITVQPVPGGVPR